MPRGLARSARLFSAVLLAPASTLGQASRDSTKAPVPLVLPGVRVLESPAERDRLAGSLAFVDSTTLLASRAFTVNEVLRKVPGLFARDEEGFGLRPNIGFRGLNPTRSTKVLLLEDGVPITLAPYGDNASYYHPPIDRVEAIEVVKGAGQLLHGPHTIGGVVNYLTPSIPVHPGGTITVAPGSRSILKVHGRYGGTFNGTGLLLDVLRKQGDGGRANTSSALSDASLKVLVPLAAGHALTIRANAYAERSRVTYSGLTESEFSADPLQNPFQNDRMALDRFGFVVSHRGGATAARQITSSLYTHAIQRDWWRQSSNSTQRPNDRSDPSCGGMTNLSTTCGIEGRLRAYRVAGLETRVSRIVGEAWSGWEVRTDLGVRVHVEDQERLQVNAQAPTARTIGPPTNVNSGLLEDNRRETRGLAGWIVGTLTRGGLTITPGVRLEHVRLSRTNRRPTPSHPLGASGTTSLMQAIPGAGVSFRVSDALTLFAGLHRGFAPPRPEDAISNADGGVVDLDAELSWNMELGLRARLGASASATLTAFRMDFSNQIVPSSVAGGTGAVLANAGRTGHAGFELALSTGRRGGRAVTPFADVASTYLPVARFESARFVYVGTGGTDVLDKVYLEPDAVGMRQRLSVNGNRLPYAPQWLNTATLGLAFYKKGDVRVEAVHTGAQFADPLNTRRLVPDGQQGVIPRSLVWNAAANLALPALGSSAFVTVKNLTDLRYVVDRTRGLLPGMPRLVQAGVTRRL